MKIGKDAGSGETDFNGLDRGEADREFGTGER
jgi:hypothetical protein